MPGPMGVMSKSGTLSYEAGYRLAGSGVGTSVWIGVGGDAVKGTRFAELIPFFARDEQTEALLIIGEIGGNEEEEFAAGATVDVPASTRSTSRAVSHSRPRCRESRPLTRPSP